ncbi:MAG: YfhO family protein [Candidatus Sumerlaeaceae bacterium]|nr:YfhO family protein [Candidatus Sumerlaeaceae bacterium]
MTLYRGLPKSLRLLILLLAITVYLFGFNVPGSPHPGTSMSFSRLWHIPALEQFQSRGCVHLPLWWSAPAAGVPLWAAGHGGQILANPLVMLVAQFSSPSLTLWLCSVVNFLLAWLGCVIYLGHRRLPRLLTWAAAVVYAASPFVVALNTEGWHSMAAVAVGLPWTTHALRVISINPARISARLAFLLSCCYVCLVGGWAYFLALLLAALCLAPPKSWGLRQSHLTWWFWLASAAAVVAMVGSIFAIPHLEFLYHSAPTWEASLARPTIAFLGLLVPLPAKSSTYIPYFSILGLFAFATLSFKSFREFLRPVAAAASRIVACFLGGAAIFWFLEKVPLDEAFVIGAALAVLAGSLMLFNRAIQGAYYLLRRPVAMARRCAIYLGIIAGVAFLAYAIARTSSPASGSSGAHGHSPFSAVEWGGGAKGGAPVIAARPESDESCHESAHEFSQSGLWLRQGVILCVVAILLLVSRTLGARRSFVTLLIIVLLDLRLSYTTSVARAANTTGVVSRKIEEMLKTDRQSRLFIPSVLVISSSSFPSVFPNILTYPAARLPKRLAFALQKHPVVSPAAPRISTQAQLVYLASSGVRWVLLAGDQAGLEAFKNLEPVWEESPWRLYQLSPRPLRVQIWQRASRVHDAVQALALTLNRDWHAEEIYVEGPVPSECLRPSGKGTFGRGEAVWDVGCDLGVSVDAPVPAVAVFSDSTYPGWKAWLNDKPAILLRANGWMRALAVPEGKSLVRMTFQPASFRLGAWLSFIGLTTAFLLIIPLRRTSAT